MTGTTELRRTLAGWLREKGLDAVTAWGEEKRQRPAGAVAAVSLRGVKSAPAGYQDYLGERFDEKTGAWEELYGKKVELTFGLDLYAATADQVLSGLERLGELLNTEGPEGMVPVGFTAGETTYQAENRRYFCPAQADFQVWAVAAAKEDGSFLDFAIKGENKA